MEACLPPLVHAALSLSARQACCVGRPQGMVGEGWYGWVEMRELSSHLKIIPSEVWTEGWHETMVTENARRHGMLEEQRQHRDGTAR